MSTFSEQGTGANAKPHLLIARITGWGGVDWEIQCPYDGPRECGTLEQCYGSPKEQEKHGCPPRPEPPRGMPVDFGEHKADPGAKEAWEAFDKAMDEWRDEHVKDQYHRTEQCWFELGLKQGWFDAEEFLMTIPEGTEIVSPMKVLVGHDGYDEDTTPKFKIWEE
jgi:hypothetical protein